MWRPKESQTAVVKGAVICGIEKSSTSNLTLIATPCRRSYGIIIDKLYSEVTCNPKDRGRQAETNQVIAAAQMQWLINKVYLVLPNDPRVRHEFTTIVRKDGERTGEVTIWSCDKDEEYRPDRFHDNRNSNYVLKS